MSLKNRLKKHQKYGYWVVLEDPISTKTTVECLCTGCGITTKQISYVNLIKGKTKSCGCQKSKITQQTVKQKYNVEFVSQSEEVKNTLKRNLLQKYGVDNISKVEEIKQKKIFSSVEKYGTQHPMQSQDYREHWKQNFKQKHDVESPSQLEAVKQKKKNTCLDKYQADCYLSSQQGKRKIKQTLQQKYHVDNCSQIPEVKHKKRLNAETNLMKLLSDGSTLQSICLSNGISCSYGFKIFDMYGEQFFLEFCNNYKKRITSVEQRFIEIMKPDFSLTKWNKSPLEFKTKRRPDFRLELNDKILYINVDGLFEHSELGRSSTSRNYHKLLADQFTSNYQTIFQFREDELRDKSSIVKSIICNYLSVNIKKYNARDLQIRPVSRIEAKKFFDQNHLMGYSSATCYGLFEQQQLISCISVKIYNNNVLDIVRFCNKLQCNVRGGFSKLLKHVIRIYNPQKIQSWCDLRYSTGVSYRKLGFELDRVTLGWKWTDGRCTFNRLRCRAGMDDLGLSQKQQAEKFGWYKIYDAGQAKYILQIDKI